MSAREIDLRGEVPGGRIMQAVRKAMAQPLADYYLLIAVTAALTVMGLFMVLSASSVYAMATKGDAYYFERWQLGFAAVGAIAAIILSRLGQKAYLALAWLGLGFAIVLLAVTLLPSNRGAAVGGQQAWLSIGSLHQVQPSEFAKAALVLWGAAIFARPSQMRNLDNWRHLFRPYLSVAGLVLALVLAELDLGTAVVFGAIIILQLWFVGAPGKFVAWLTGLFVAGGVAVMLGSSTHRAKLIDFLALRFPSLGFTPSPGASDQPNNAIYGLATGGWWGVGPGASRQKWGGLYNGAHTDYILAVLGEELGLFGVLIVLGLLFALLYTGLRVARRSNSMFWRVASAGVVGWIAVQAGINTMVAFGLLPVIGVPFPFLSYGGSALIACFIGIGVLLAAARHEPEALAELQTRREARRGARLSGVVVARPAK